MNYGGRACALIAVLMVMVFGVPVLAQAEPVGDGPSVMLVGDSITQGSTGEYTWRYFLSTHLASSGSTADLVGPHDEVWQGDLTKWPAVYARPDFDTDHAATWGDSLAFPRHDRDHLLAAYRPDVVVLQLGINDLTWLALPPGEVRELVVQWIQAARQSLPGTDFVVVEVGSSILPAASAYNTLLRDLPGTLTVPGSAVEVATVATGFVTGTDPDESGADTYDPGHPNTSGQVKYAAAVADALARLGVGAPYPRPLVVPREGPRAKPVVKVAGTADAQVSLGWSAPPGADNFDVWRRTGKGAWVRVARQVFGTSASIDSLAPCVRHTFRVRARRGLTLAHADMTSSQVAATVGPWVSARPALRLARRAGGAVASWSRVPGACTYEARVSTKWPRGQRVLTTAGTRVAIKGLRSGSRVEVRVRAVGGRNPGPYSRAVTVRLP